MLSVRQPDATRPRGDSRSRPGLHLVAEGSLGPMRPTLPGGLLTAIEDVRLRVACASPASAPWRRSLNVAVEASEGTPTTGPGGTGCY
jgi:hypothetical protein